MIDSSAHGWIDQVIDFMDKFYHQETRTAVRKEALSYLGNVVAENSLTQEVGRAGESPLING